MGVRLESVVKMGRDPLRSTGLTGDVSSAVHGELLRREFG